MKVSNTMSRSARALLRSNNQFRTTPFSTLSRGSIRTSTVSKRTTTCYTTSHMRSFSTTPTPCKGLSPDSTEPKAPNPESTHSTDFSPAQISDSEYHEIADQYLNTLVLTLEDMAEDPSAGIEVEYSAGVLTINHPKGNYVINKQPPNKQIWLASPLSGPKRYDWVVTPSVSMGQKQESEGASEVETGDDGAVGGGRWIYLRDGESMSGLLKKELDVDMGESDASEGQEGPGGGGSKLE